MSTDVGRYAPSTTGDAHPGTLLAGLLAWLDARSRGARIVLRLEDLDVTRVKSGFADTLREALAWIGLDWDDVQVQARYRERHAAALDVLARQGRLYPCSCSRAAIKRGGRTAPDGSYVYANTCRHRALPRGGWQETGENIRVQLPDERVVLRDESGLDLSQDVTTEMGDPIVYRKDGVVAYQLAVVVDDAAAGVTRVVRGRDIAPSTATQVVLQRLLGLPTPAYRHHFLLLEPQGKKLAKLHGSIASATLRDHYTGEQLCGWLAQIAGLAHTPTPTLPRSLIGSFDWSRVETADVAVRFNGEALVRL